MTSVPLRRIVLQAVPLIVVFAIGIFLRVHSFETVKGEGFDEQMVAAYVQQISDPERPVSYPGLIEFYLKGQSAYPIALPPPTRMTFILAADFWHRLTGDRVIESVRAVLCAASILVLFVSCAFAWRVRDRSFALAVVVLMAVAPTQVFMAHRGLIDGFFTLFAMLVLWSLWEVLREARPMRVWLGVYALSLVLVVLTKENAAFVYLAVLALLAANRWVRFGRVSSPALIATFAAPLVALLILTVCSGGIGPLIHLFTLNIAKSLSTPYAVSTGGGPWFRYLSDLLLVSPVALIFAIGGAFSLRPSDAAGRYLLGFVVFSYVLMCNVPYGMNLRYANMWDFPIRYLALVPVFLWSGSIARERNRVVFLTSIIGLIAGVDFCNYLKIFVSSTVYDPVPGDLMRALDIIRPG